MKMKNTIKNLRTNVERVLLFKIESHIFRDLVEIRILKDSVLAKVRTSEDFRLIEIDISDLDKTNKELKDGKI